MHSSSPTPTPADRHRLAPVVRLTRARLTDPVRFYAYGVLVGLVVVQLVVAAITGAWAVAAACVLAQLLAVIPGAELATRSALAPAYVVGVLAAAREATARASAAAVADDVDVTLGR